MNCYDSNSDPRYVTVALVFFAALAFFSLLFAPARAFNFVGQCALVYLLGQYSALAVWVGLGSPRFAVRLSLAVFPAVGLIILILVLDALGSAPGDPSFLACFVYLLSPFIVPFCLLLRSLRLRIVRFRSWQEEQRFRTNERPFQFSLGQMFVLTAAIASLAFFARLMSQDISFLYVGPIAVLLAGLNFVAGGAAWAALGKRAPIAHLIVLSIAITTLSIPMMTSGLWPGFENVSWAGLCSLTCGVTLLFYRRLGYQIVRIPRAVRSERAVD